MARAATNAISTEFSIFVEALPAWRSGYERLRVSVPATLGARPFLPLLVTFRELHPDIQIEFQLDSGTPGHTVPTPDSHARRIVTPAVVCASRNYWRANSRPSVPSYLASHDCITAHTNERWQFQDVNGALYEAHVDGHFQSMNAEFALQAVLQDQGIAMLPLFMAAEYLWSGQLESAFEHLHPTATFTNNVVCASRPGQDSHALLLADLLVAHFREDTACPSRTLQADSMEFPQRAAHC